MMRRLLQMSILVLLLPLQLFAAAGNGTVVEGDSVARARAFDYFYIQAISLREAEKYDEAFDMLEHCLALQPSSPIVQYELYSMYCYLGRKEEALAMIENASLGDPGNYWYRTMLADAYYDSGNRGKALEVYEAMARDFSSHSEIYSILFQMYAEEKEYVKAIEALDNVERIEGKNEQLTLQKCRIYTMMEKLDLVINLEEWDNNKMYDRLGLDEQTTNILGIEVPSITLPVSSGRNLSVVIEVAAMNNRQKRMGYNTAKEFNKRLMESMGME